LQFPFVSHFPNGPRFLFPPLLMQTFPGLTALLAHTPAPLQSPLVMHGPNCLAGAHSLFETTNVHLDVQQDAPLKGWILTPRLLIGCPGSHCSGAFTCPFPQPGGATGFDEAAIDVGIVPRVGEPDLVPDIENTPAVCVGGTPEGDGDAPNDKEDVGDPVGGLDADPVFDNEVVIDVVIDLVFVAGPDAETETETDTETETELLFEVEVDQVPDPLLLMEMLLLTVTDPVTETDFVPVPDMELEPEPVPVPVRVGVPVIEMDWELARTIRAKKARNLRSIFVVWLLCFEKRKK